MAFQVSPGVNVSEIDLTAVVPAVQSTSGAIAGEFRWGPVETVVLVDNEERLVANFQTPDNNTADDFFTAANFLAYGNSLNVVRVVNTDDAQNATLNDANSAQTIIKNLDDYNENYSSGITGVGDFVSKYPGELGNSLKVSVCPSADAFQSTLSGTYSITSGNTEITFSANQASVLSVGDVLTVGPTRERLSVETVDAGGLSATLESAYQGAGVTTETGLVRQWEYAGFFDRAPGTTTSVANAGGSNDQLHIIVLDEDGFWTGVKGQALEKFSAVSYASDAKKDDGANNYYKNVVNNQSKYLWWAQHNVANVNAGQPMTGTTYAGGTVPQTASFVNGSNGTSATEAQKMTGYGLFASAESVDVSLILGSSATQAIAVYLINNIAESRKDCIVCLSPERADVINNSLYAGAEADSIVEFRNSLPSSSYAVMDSGWKYQYDKYNDLYRYVPLNGDTAGAMVRTDETRDPWFSPAGFTRGQIKNVIKLAFNPNKAERDTLYKAGVNPVVSFPGQGTVLFGDKTLLAQPSAFDRINVRRLFIVLEKAIAAAAQTQLFEFNDEFTRTQFVNIVEPFLRDVQGRRGITDFRVVADESNNTAEIIDRNEFVGDIFIKPTRSINFIQLNFVAVRSGVEFSEVAGAV